MATMTRYHPDQFLLNDYVAGSLPGAVALAIAVHLDYCPQCRAEVGQLSRLGGELFGGLDPVPVAEDAFARLLQRLDDIPPAAAAGAVPARGHGASQGLPRALRTLVPAGVDQLDWQRSGAACAPRGCASVIRGGKWRCTRSGPAHMRSSTGTAATRSPWC